MLVVKILNFFERRYSMERNNLYTGNRYVMYQHKQGKYFQN